MSSFGPGASSSTVRSSGEAASSRTPRPGAAFGCLRRCHVGADRDRPHGLDCHATTNPNLDRLAHCRSPALETGRGASERTYPPVSTSPQAAPCATGPGSAALEETSTRSSPTAVEADRGLLPSTPPMPALIPGDAAAGSPTRPSHHPWQPSPTACGWSAPRSSPVSTSPQAAPLCYWARLSGFGGNFDEIIANGSGSGQRIVTIDPSDAGFDTGGCGSWQSHQAIASPLAAIPDGMWMVGPEVQPGTYVAPGGDLCYWARLSGFGGNFDEIIANGSGSGQRVVTIDPSDAGFDTGGCGTWSPG